MLMCVLIWFRNRPKENVSREMAVQKKTRHSANQALFDDYVIRATEKFNGDAEKEFNRLFEVVEKIKKNILIPPQRGSK